MADAQERLERRVAELEAIESILALKGRYWRSVDLGDADGVAACLAEDAVVDFEGMPRFDGAAPFLDMVRAAAGQPGAFHMHHGRNPVVRLTGPNTAEGEWDIYYSGVLLGPRMLIQMAGAYSDRYRRDGDRWVVAAMTMRQTSFLVHTVGDDGVPRATTLPGAGTADTLQETAR